MQAIAVLCVLLFFVAHCCSNEQVWHWAEYDSDRPSRLAGSFLCNRPCLLRPGGEPGVFNLKTMRCYSLVNEESSRRFAVINESWPGVFSLVKREEALCSRALKSNSEPGFQERRQSCYQAADAFCQFFHNGSLKAGIESRESSRCLGLNATSSESYYLLIYDNEWDSCPGCFLLLFMAVPSIAFLIQTSCGLDPW